MINKKYFATSIFILAIFIAASGKAASSISKSGNSVKTNKDKLLMIAVEAQISHPQPSRSYVITWDGKPKLAAGTGGINYNLKLGDKIFGWAGADRATVGVATENTDERANSSWATMTCIGNEVVLTSGQAKGQKGIVIGKFGTLVLVHFDDGILDKLAIGDGVRSRARGFGLKISGFDDVFVHHLSPEILEKIVSVQDNNHLSVPVVKVIPAELVGQGAGGSSLIGHWHIQTCYPPDIKKYGLDDLCFGDLVLLEDTQTDYGKGYFKGAATVGVISSGPSDISGLGIGVTPVLSSRAGKIVPRLDAGANIGKFLGLKIKKIQAKPQKESIETNGSQLVTTAVQGVVLPARGPSFSPAYDGQPKADIGMASINYSVSVGDSVYGWASADHVEPDVTIQGRDRTSPSECALAILACIGNDALVVSGEARGGRGYYIGRHAGADDLVWFPPDVRDKLGLNDRIQVKARGVGLQIKGFEDVRVNKISPELLGKLGLRKEGDSLVVPVVMEVPGYIMGSGLGGWFIETGDYDIQTTDPEIIGKFNLKTLKLGDLVAILDHYDVYGRGRYPGAITIGVCVHGFSDYSGHGPGLNPILSALPGRLKTRIDPSANIAYALGIRKPEK